jgi:hypothetical protein
MPWRSTVIVLKGYRCTEDVMSFARSTCRSSRALIGLKVHKGYWAYHYFYNRYNLLFEMRIHTIMLIRNALVVEH